MDDLIRRQDAIDALDCMNGTGEVLMSLPSADEYEIVKEYCNSRCLTLIDSWYLQCLNNGIIVQHDPQWIPCSERLPEEHLCDDGYIEPSDYVLVWGDCGNYGLSRYWGNRQSKSENPYSFKDWMDLDWVAQKPIAWMPLPEPYKESEDEE